jgi:catechol 2,3-dioxygenase-like lactoylglutathione lyase family enzyme
MDHVGVVVDDLAAATEFFVELGLVLQGEMPVEGRWVDRIVALEGPANSVPVRISGHPRRRSPRIVDARWTSRRQLVVSAANERS